MIEKSKPFSSGMEFEFFHENFCDRCKKLKLDKDFTPKRNNCKTNNALFTARFDEKAWPENDIVRCGKYFHLCKHFETDNIKTMHNYKKLFKED